jgi:hypothetical protein
MIEKTKDEVGRENTFSRFGTAQRRLTAATKKGRHLAVTALFCFCLPGGA